MGHPQNYFDEPNKTCLLDMNVNDKEIVKLCVRSDTCRNQWSFCMFFVLCFGRIRP